jgi:AsmA protein
MRKLGIAVLVLVVLLLAAALIVPHLVDINQYHDRIQAELQKRLGRSVSLGEMKLSLLPPSFAVQNAIIGEDGTFNTGRPFAATENLSVSVKFWPLLRKEVEIKSLSLERPQIELVRNAQGVWNYSTLGEQTKPAPSSRPEPNTPAPTPQAPQQQQPAPASSQPSFTLANLDINDGQVAITDVQKHQPRAVYDHIDLAVRDFAPNQVFAIKMAAHLPGPGKQTVSLEGQGGPIQPDIMNTNFDGSLSLSQVSISGVEKFLNSPALSGMEASVSGDAKVKNSGGKLASSGTIKLDNPQIHNVSVGYPITLDYDIADDMKTDILQIQRGDVKLGSTPVSIAGTINSKTTPSQLDLKLKASDASIGEAARLASAFGVAFGKGTDVNGRISADIVARGPSSAPALNGHLSARDLVISGKELAQPVKAGDVELTLTPDTIRSNDFTASTGATTVTANIVLTQYTGPASVINAALRMPNARIAEVLNIAKAYGIAAVEGMSGDGALQLDVRVQGPTKNISALNFNGSGKIQNANLNLPSLTKPVTVRNADIRFSQNSAMLQNLSASVGQTNATGSLTLKNFAAPQVQFTLNADKVNVAEMQQLTATPPVKRAGVSNDHWSVFPAANAEPTNQPSAVNKMTGSGTVNIGTVQYDDLVLTNAKSNVSLDKGLIQLNPVTANLYGGSESGNVIIDMRPAQPVYTVNMKTDKVDANKLISSVSSVKQTLYGLLASNVNASFSSTSAESIARGLNGSVGLNLVNGKLVGLDLLHELANVGKFLSGVPGGQKGFTNIVQLVGNFDIKNGVAQTNNLKATIDGGTFAANGLVDLASQQLNLHVNAVLSKALSQQVGGTQIGGFMNTALANNLGELVLPVIITGTFQHPQVAPDVKAMAEMRLQNLLPTSKNPGALTSGILGAVLGQGQNGQQKGGVVGGILGAIGGQQQQQQGNPPADSQPQSDRPPGNQPQANPQQQQNPLGDLLNQLGNKKKKQQQQQQQNPPPQKPPEQ